VSVISLATNKLDQGVDFVEEEHFKFWKPVEGNRKRRTLPKYLVVLKLKYLVMIINWKSQPT
jgi:hypothetical protein